MSLQREVVHAISAHLDVQGEASANELGDGHGLTVSERSSKRLEDLLEFSVYDFI